MPFQWIYQKWKDQNQEFHYKIARFIPQDLIIHAKMVKTVIIRRAVYFLQALMAVSYTHLDVYKRQIALSSFSALCNPLPCLGG